jgi:hypothetical protein
VGIVAHNKSGYVMQCKSEAAQEFAALISGCTGLCDTALMLI